MNNKLYFILQIFILHIFILQINCNQQIINKIKFKLQVPKYINCSIEYLDKYNKPDNCYKFISQSIKNYLEILNVFNITNNYISNYSLELNFTNYMLNTNYHINYNEDYYNDPHYNVIGFIFLNNTYLENGQLNYNINLVSPIFLDNFNFKIQIKKSFNFNNQILISLYEMIKLIVAFIIILILILICHIVLLFVIYICNKIINMIYLNLNKYKSNKIDNEDI